MASGCSVKQLDHGHTDSRLIKYSTGISRRFPFLFLLGLEVAGAGSSMIQTCVYNLTTRTRTADCSCRCTCRLLAGIIHLSRTQEHGEVFLYRSTWPYDILRRR